MSADLLAVFGRSSSAHITGDTVSRSDQTRVQSGPDSRSKSGFEGGNGTPLPVGKLDRLMESTSRVRDRTQPDPDILFDASDEELESDDFGEFEGVASPTSAEEAPSPHIEQPFHASIHLLNLKDDEFPSTPRELMNSNRSPTFDVPLIPSAQEGNEKVGDDDWGTFEEPTILGQGKLSASQMQPVNAYERYELAKETDGGWNEWEDDISEWSAKTATMPPETEKLNAAQSSSRALDSKISTDLDVTVRPERPTRVPPPSHLLQGFSNLIERLGADSTSQDCDFSSVAQSIVQFHQVGSRIIAGRVLRWNRDAVLAQSMKIGPSGSGKGSGMKLQAISRNEMVREEQEIEQAIQTWTKLLPRFSAVLSKASYGQRRLILSAKLVPKKLHEPGVLTAHYICAVCGLRRDERLQGVDDKDSDLFGEYWIEHWGHKACADFWKVYGRVQ